MYEKLWRFRPQHTNIKNYNDFRKGLLYWVDVFNIYKILSKEKYTHVYILDKINKPAIAAKFAGIKNIIGPGIKNQKKWLTCKNFLEDKDWNLSYSEQSQKFLNINNININTLVPSIIIDKTRLDNLCINFNNLKGDKIAFGVDSFEEYKMWHEEYFVELAEKLFQKKIAKYFYLICGPNNKNISKKIIELSKKEYFIDCSNLNLLEVIKIILDSKFFIGNNSGPLNLSAALNVKPYGLIANSPASQLKYSNIKIITPDEYIDNVFNKDRDEMRKLTVDKVFNSITIGMRF